MKQFAMKKIVCEFCGLAQRVLENVDIVGHRRGHGHRKLHRQFYFCIYIAAIFMPNIVLQQHLLPDQESLLL